jgi:alpha-D-xyloside xylohydrolase
VFKTFLSGLIALGWAGAALAGSYQHLPDGVAIHPDKGPARMVRLQVMQGGAIHVFASPQSGAAAAASLAVVARPARAGFRLTARAGQVALSTERLTAEASLVTGAVRFRDRAGRPILVEQGRAFEPVKVEGRDYYAVRQQFNPGTDEGFFGLGQRQNGQMNYNGEDVELAQHNMDVAIPFVVSTRNYGVLWDNTSITRFGDPKAYGPISRDLKVVDADGREGGLTARYYVGGQLKLTRTEPGIDYPYIKDLEAWPAGLKGARDQKVVWEGRIEARTGGVHKFRLYVSSYARLWIDGKLVSDSWRQNWNPWHRNFELPMQVGQAHQLKLEWEPNDGYIALLHNDPLAQADRHSLWLSSEAARGVDYYVVAGKDLDEVISGYRRLTGKAVMMPRWAYGFWQSRQRYETQAQLLDVLHEYRKRRLPLDNIVQDWMYWREDDWGSHRFDPGRFPDPKGMIDEIHAQNAHLMVSIWAKFYPATAHFKELDAQGHMYRRNLDMGARDWVGPGYASSFYDPYSPEARRTYWRQVKASLKVLGVDAWWMDSDEPDIHSNLDIEERKLRMSPTAMGPGGAYFNAYPLMHTAAVYDGERAEEGGQRAFILSRSAFAGQQRNASALWSGDVTARWSDLEDQISAGVNLSMSGLPNWTFDIGGYTVEPRFEHPDEAALQEWRELQLRWFQFGAFAPLFRSHGELVPREIWNIAPAGTEVYDSLAWYDRLRYRLMPYIYTLAGDTYHRDGTIMRGLVMDFPADRRSWGVNDEYLFGPAFLVSPVHRFNARSRSVYLPAGVDWYDFYSGVRHAGGERIEADAPLARMPLFVKAGSIVPIGPEVEHTGQKPQGPITLYVYAGRDGAFELYEDDGVSYGYEKGQFSRIPIRWDDRAGALTIGARQGRWPGMPERRTFRVRWISGPAAGLMDFDGPADRTLVYDGRLLRVRRQGTAGVR